MSTLTVAGALAAQTLGLALRMLPVLRPAAGYALCKMGRQVVARYASTTATEAINRVPEGPTSRSLHTNAHVFPDMTGSAGFGRLNQPLGAPLSRTHVPDDCDDYQLTDWDTEWDSVLAARANSEACGAFNDPWRVVRARARGAPMAERLMEPIAARYSTLMCARAAPHPMEDVPTYRTAQPAAEDFTADWMAAREHADGAAPFNYAE